mgnify:CR=1 FL=1
MSSMIDDERKKLDEKAILEKETGISDSLSLENAIELGLHSKNYRILELIPLVKMAWADGIFGKKEEKIVKEVARERQIDHLPSFPELLDIWRRKSPNPNFFLIWKEWVQSQKEKMVDAEFDQYAQKTLNLCEKVARSSGGVWGIRSVSDKEKKTLQKIKSAL